MPLETARPRLLTPITPIEIFSLGDVLLGVDEVASSAHPCRADEAARMEAPAFKNNRRSCDWFIRSGSVGKGPQMEVGWVQAAVGIVLRAEQIARLVTRLCGNKAPQASPCIRVIGAFRPPQAASLDLAGPELDRLCKRSFHPFRSRTSSVWW